MENRARGQRKNYQDKKKYFPVIKNFSKGQKYNGSHRVNGREQCIELWLKHPN